MRLGLGQGARDRRGRVERFARGQGNGGAIEGRDPAEVHRAIGAGDAQGAVTGGENGAGGALPVSRFSRADPQEGFALAQLGQAQRIGVAAEIEAPDQRADLGGRFGEIELSCALGPVVAREIAALAQILRAALERAGLELAKHGGKAFHARGIAAGVEAEGGLVLGEVDQHLGEDVALVHAAFDHVPGHAMLRLAVDHGPGGGVETGIARQRPVVEVHGPLGRQRQHRVRNHGEVGDAEHPVDPAGELRLEQRLGRVDDRDPLPFGPGPHLGIGTDHGAHGMAARDDHVATGDGQRFGPEDHAGEGGWIEGSGHDLSSAGVRYGFVAAWAMRSRRKRGGSSGLRPVSATLSRWIDTPAARAARAAVA